MSYKQMTYEEWDAHTTELQNRYGYKGVAPSSAGALAKVSIYEFVNDWVRPEISWKIFSYLGDPHKKAIKKNKSHKRVYREASRKYNRPAKWFWHLRKVHEERVRQSFYRKLGQPYGSVWRLNMKEFISCYTRYYGLRQEDLSECKLKYTNPILHELWSLHASKTNGAGNKKFLVTKNKIKEILKINKVSGRTDLVFGVRCSETFGGCDFYISRPNNGWMELTRPPVSRVAVVGVLMKM